MGSATVAVLGGAHLGAFVGGGRFAHHGLRHHLVGRLFALPRARCEDGFGDVGISFAVGRHQRFVPLGAQYQCRLAARIGGQFCDGLGVGGRSQCIGLVFGQHAYLLADLWHLCHCADIAGMDLHRMGGGAVWRRVGSELALVVARAVGRPRFSRRAKLCLVFGVFALAGTSPYAKCGRLGAGWFGPTLAGRPLAGTRGVGHLGAT